MLHVLCYGVHLKYLFLASSSDQNVRCRCVCEPTFYVIFIRFQGVACQDICCWSAWMSRCLLFKYLLTRCLFFKYLCRCIFFYIFFRGICLLRCLLVIKDVAEVSMYWSVSLPRAYFLINIFHTTSFNTVALVVVFFSVRLCKNSGDCYCKNVCRVHLQDS